MSGTWIVAVRNEQDDGTYEFYGVFGSERSAKRKTDAINKRLEAAGLEVATAYACRLNGATWTSDVIASRAAERTEAGGVR